MCEKKSYVSPDIEHIELDSEMSLLLSSDPYPKHEPDYWVMNTSEIKPLNL